MPEAFGLRLRCVRVFHLNILSNSTGPISTAYRKYEEAKKWTYGQREVRTGGIYTPLVISYTYWGNGTRSQHIFQEIGRLKTREAILYHHKLAKMQVVIYCLTFFHYNVSMEKGTFTIDPTPAPGESLQHLRGASQKMTKL